MSREQDATTPAFVPNDLVQNEPAPKEHAVAAAPVLVSEPIVEKEVKAPGKPKKAAKTVEPVAETAVAAETAPKAKAEKKPATRKPKPAKPIDLAASDLQLVETKGDAKMAAPAAEPAKPKGPRKAPSWKKNAESKADDAPLVMVETQK